MFHIAGFFNLVRACDTQDSLLEKQLPKAQPKQISEANSATHSAIVWKNVSKPIASVIACSFVYTRAKYEETLEILHKLLFSYFEMPC